jgi:hypothetical protein
MQLQDCLNYAEVEIVVFISTLKTQEQWQHHTI